MDVISVSSTDPVEITQQKQTKEPKEGRQSLRHGEYHCLWCLASDFVFVTFVTMIVAVQDSAADIHTGTVRVATERRYFYCLYRYIKLSPS
jgi:hypothetical protein